MQNAVLKSHQTVSAISASEANEIGLYSSDVISLLYPCPLRKKSHFQRQIQQRRWGPVPKTLVVSRTGATKSIFLIKVPRSLRSKCGDVIAIFWWAECG